MKFTEGMWRIKSGLSINWMGNVERTHIDKDEISLLLTKPQSTRGDTLNTGTLTATVRSPLEGIIAVNFSHWTGNDDAGPYFPLFESKPNVKINHPEGKLLEYVSESSTNRALKLSVNTVANKLAFDYSDNSGRLTGHSFRSIGLVSKTDTPTYDISEGLYADYKNYILLELDVSVGEKIYGLGERFGPFIKNGQTVDIWNEDGGTSSELTYKNIPFYISSKGYGVFINNTGKVMLEIQSERTTRINIVIQGESLEYMIIAGSNPKDILNRYTALTGRPGLPPGWSYGLWLTTSFTTSYTEETVTGFLDGFKERSIPLSVFHFDAFWMKSFQWCDFTFDSDRFPDARGYLNRLKDRGFKLCVWINPYVAQASPLFAEGKKHGYFIMRADTPRATVWQWDNWLAGMAVVDFTNPEAIEWYSSHLKRLMDLGVDAFKTDFAERIPFNPKKVRYHNGSDPVRMHNFYAYLYNKTVYETMNSHGKDACLFARAATAGGQQFPVHWGGDCESTFEAMAETLRGGLSLGLSGFAFWAHDIGGFEGLPDPALYKRWVQFGLLGSHSRLHGSSSYRVPWIYDEERFPGEDQACSKVLRESVLRKFTLLPYLLRKALEGHEYGTPVMRAMLLEFGETDPNVWAIDTQYMLGDSLLVAPVFSADGKVTFYVPRTGNKTGAKWRSYFEWEKDDETGRWINDDDDFIQTRTYEEGRWYTEVHGFNTLPLLVRPGAVIAVNPSLKTPQGNVLDGLKVLINGPLAKDHSVEIVESGSVKSVSKTLTVTAASKLSGLDGVEIVDLTTTTP